MARDITELRDILFETIYGVRKGTVNIEQAKQVVSLSQVLVNTVNAETDYLKALKSSQGSGFINSDKSLPLHSESGVPVKTIFVGDFMISDGKASRLNTENIRVDIDLTSQEFDLIHFFAIKSPKICTKEDVVNGLFDGVQYKNDAHFQHTMQVLMNKVNNSFDKRVLFYRKDVGYFMKEDIPSIQ